MNFGDKRDLKQHFNTLAWESVDLESSSEAANYQLCDFSRNKRRGLGRAVTLTEHLLCARHMSYTK